MRRLLTASVIAASTALAAFHPPVAHAVTITATLYGSWTVSESDTNSSTKPTIGTPNSSFGTFGTTITGLNNPSTINAFTSFTPKSDGNDDGKYVTPLGQKLSTNKYEYETATVAFTGLKVTSTQLGVTNALVNTTGIFGEGGVFQALWNNSTAVACAAGDGVSPDGSGNSDCFDWNTAGVVSVSNTSSSNYAEWVYFDLPIVGVANYDVQIGFQNATDWTVYPNLSVQIVDAPPTVPEPATLSLLGVGLLGIGAFVRRRRA